MKITERMKTDVRAIGRDESLERAAQLMWEHDCGCVPVVDLEQRVVGMITDRDVCMGAYTQGRALREIPVEHCMSREVHDCRPNDSVEVAAGIMSAHQVRRLPVVDEAGRLIGMIALCDLTRTVEELKGEAQKKLLREEIARTLEAISQPHHVSVRDTLEPVRAANLPRMSEFRPVPAPTASPEGEKREALQRGSARDDGPRAAGPRGAGPEPRNRG